MANEAELIQMLRERQTTLGLSDAAMAFRLGVSRELWNQTRLGKKKIKAKLLHGIVRGFPELTTDCLDFLRRNGTIVTVHGPSVPHQAHQGEQGGPSEEAQAS